jgi:ClpP class serine protease
MSMERADSLGQGRVWTGLAARERGLVDALGGFESAFAMLRAKAGLDPDEALEVERLPRVRVSLVQNLVDGLFQDEEGGAAGQSAVSAALRTLAAVASFPAGTALAHLPFAITIR